MRPAAAAWEKDFSSRFKKEGFAQGVTSSSIFYDATNQIYIVVHGDDFTVLGYPSELVRVEVLMRLWYDIKVRRV